MTHYDAVRLPRTVCSIALLAVLAVGAGGCTPAFIRDFREAGSCHVAVLSVTRWDDYKAELQPKFEMTADKALAKATPDTMVLDQAVLDGLRARVGLNLAPSKDLPAARPTDATGVGALPTNLIPNTTLPAFGAASDANRVGKDPMLEYLGATALYQEVKMLNRYVKDASIQKGYKAYVVRLQIAQMPGMRKANYDLYMSIGFYFDDFNKSRHRESLKEDSNTPLIVPLLVTDQVEGAMRSRRAERLTEIVLALSAAYAGIGGKVDIDAISQKIERALGRSYNSLLTVGRQGENVLRVRMGARQTASGPDEYEAIPRTQNISLLVLVPEKKAEKGTTVFVGTRRQLRRPDTGAMLWPDILGLRKIPADINVKNNVADTWKRVTGKSVWCHDCDNEQLLWNAADLAGNGRYNEFLTLFTETKNNMVDKATIADLNRVWLDLVSADTCNPHDRTQFTVPAYPPLAPMIKCAPATMLDDGDATVAVINMVRRDLDPGTISAIWTFAGDPNKPKERITFAATKAELRAKNQLLLTFPSANKFKLTVAQPTCDANCLTGEVTEIDPSRQLLYVTYNKDPETCDPNTVALKWRYNLIEKTDRKTEPIKALTVTSSIEKLTCNAPCRTDLVLNLVDEGKDGENAKKGFWMEISGASLDPTATTPPVSDPAGILRRDTVKPFRWNITKPGNVTLNFKPLAPGTSVKVSFGAPEGMTVEPKELVFPVADAGS